MNLPQETIDRLRGAVRTERLVETAVRLIEVPSPTRSGAAVADRLAEILQRDGFEVERPAAGWADAPAVVARWKGGQPGRTLQFNGHLDTVHLPFVPPREEGGLLFGSGAADMKGGLAAAIEALRVLRETGALGRGGVLLTAHDLHESPWGDGSQVDRLIDEGYLGDGVLIPEYLSDRLAVAGRGLGILEISITREGEPVHEVLGGIDQPSVIGAGAALVGRFAEFDRRLAERTHPIAGRESLFVGQFASGEIYNQSPVECRINGTRRWLPGASVDEVRRQYRELCDATAAETGTRIEGRFHLVRDAFEIDPSSPLVEAFQGAARAIMGKPLPAGAKPFVDDGNTFASRGKVPAITHGPAGKGAHTVHEEVPVRELERVALVYALTAVAFC